MSAPSPSRSHLRRTRCAAALLLPLVLHGCITMGLWGFYPEDEQDPITGEDESGFTYDPETEWSWSLLGLRVLLTPITVALDCLTCPIQAAWFGLDDDEQGRCRCHR